jgi:dTDP-4-dehydrorhamnose reductase
MRFLIVGASGFVGRHLYRYCQATGQAVIGTQSTAGRPDLVTFDLRRDRFPHPLLTDPLPSHAVICAGITQIDRCYRERELSYLVNVTQTVRLLRDFAAWRIKPVFISTGFIFSGTTGGYSEDAPPNPVNEYGRQRLEVEQFLAEELPEALVLRLDKVVGNDPQESHLFTEWHHAALTHQPIRCIAGQVFAPTLVDDIARAIVMGCELGLAGTYHVANPEFCSRTELAERFLRTSGWSAVVETLPQQQLGFAEPRPLRTYLNPTKFQQATHLVYTPVAQILATFIARLGGRMDAPG